MDRDDELVGFCSFGEDGRVPGFDYDETAIDVGAGLRPDWTGRGEGAAFLSAIVGFARDELGLVRLRVTVADWNERALRAVRSLGFQDSTRFERADGRSFLVLLSNGDRRNPRPPRP